MKDEVMELLDQLGYTCTESDIEFIDVLINKVASDIKAVTNTSDVPEEMHMDHVFAVAGELLMIKKGSGKLELSALSFDGIKSITEGDTSVTYADNETDEGKFNGLIAYLTNWHQKAISFRKLVW